MNNKGIRLETNKIYKRIICFGDYGIATSVRVIVTCCLIVFFTLILPNVHVFPYSDEWEYVDGLAKTSIFSNPEWFFIQHGDHFIPIQKFFQGSILTLTGFDFRVLIAANFLIACSIVFFILKIAKQYRGKLLFGDIFIPLCVLNFGSGFTQWGFEFQFLSSVFFTVLFLYFVMSSEKSRNQNLMGLAFFSLIACSLCGVNGLLVSSFIGVLFAIYFLIERIKKYHSRHYIQYLSLSILVFSNVLIWIYWIPSAASTLTPSFVKSFYFFRGLLNSSLVVYAFDNALWKSMVIPLLFIMATIYFVRSIMTKAFSEPVSNTSIALIGSLLATVFCMIGLSYGRSAYNSGWSSGLEMHYGFLTTLVPIISWILVSTSSKWSLPLGFILFLVYANAFVVNANWRFQYLAESTSLNNKIQAEIADKSISAYDIANKYIKQFYWQDTPDIKQNIANGIDILRSNGGFNYKAN